jgi:predicted nucleic acid-binding protein
LARHPQHARSLAVYAPAKKADSFCSAHSLAETYAVLTRLPPAQRLSCAQALIFVEDIRKRVTIVPLRERDYFNTLASLAASDAPGGIVYDALLAQCALKINADVLYTLDAADFRRLGVEVAKRVRTP